MGLSDTAVGACDACLARSNLLESLAGHLDRARARIDELLGLADEQLLAAVGGRDRERLHHDQSRFDPAAARERVAAAGLTVICRCDEDYPAALHELAAPPATLHLTASPQRLSELVAHRPVAIVGARRGSAYGLNLARSLGRELGAAGVTVISGLALGIDSAAHRGALEVDAAVLAVLPGGADRPYPASHRRLYERICASGIVVSELGPGTAPRRWMFPARNRIIAALGAMTVVVQGATGSGSLLTARSAAELGRPVGAVPGPVNSPLSAGPHRLLADEGACLITGAQDVLDALYGAGTRTLADPRCRLDPQAAALLDAVAQGIGGPAACARAGLTIDAGLTMLASLELAGFLRRGPGGRLEVC